MAILNKYNNLPDLLEILAKQVVASPFVLDMVMDGHMVLELQAVESLPPAHDAQIYSYLKAFKMSLGSLVNFNVPLIRDGIRRFVPRQTSLLRNFA